jgi:tRNA pseudouridine38-40 synthase
MRYFLEVAYKGTRYGGSQVQKNSNSVQGELERALNIITRTTIVLTGSSRTDAGVHALQNFFHFDTEADLPVKASYNLNALLPYDIVVKSVFPVPSLSHCRFLALSRQYQYFITSVKDPFNTDTAWYYPYALDLVLLNSAANALYSYTDYTAFCKRNSNVLTHDCAITKSIWIEENAMLTYNVKANRFLRGMVRGLVGTMLLVGRKKISMSDFKDILLLRDCTKANFATPAHGLFLLKVEYPASFEMGGNE